MHVPSLGHSGPLLIIFCAIRLYFRDQLTTCTLADQARDAARNSGVYFHVLYQSSLQAKEQDKRCGNRYFPLRQANTDHLKHDSVLWSVHIRNLCLRFLRDCLLLTDENEWINNKCSKCIIIRLKFLTDSLVHICQKGKKSQRRIILWYY